MNYFFIILSVLTLLFSCNGKSDEGDATSAASNWVEPEKTPLAVEVKALKYEAFSQELNCFGFIEGEREAYIISQAQGLITECLFEVGDFVQEGDLLLRLEDDLLKSRLNYAEQDLKTAILEMEALERSLSTGGSSLVTFNQSKTRTSSAQLSYDQALKAFEDCYIRAPFDGYISSRDSDISVGNYVQVGRGITHIIDTSSFIVKSSLGEGDISKIHEGMRAKVLPNIDDTLEIEASVLAVAPGSGKSAGIFPIIVSWENPYFSEPIGQSPIQSGLSVRVSLDLTEDSKPLFILPSQAIFYRDQKSYVYKVDSSGDVERVSELAVTITFALGERVSIEENPHIKEGDLVVCSALSQLREGDPIQFSDPKAF